MSNTYKQVYYVLLLPSVSHIMKAEKILMEKNIPVKIIPVPKSISYDCGVCIRFDEKLIEKINGILNNIFEEIEIKQL